jgi:anaerobic selenocysteine-containing dehydrogenase
VEWAAKETGIPAEQIKAVAEEFAKGIFRLGCLLHEMVTPVSTE